MAAPEMGSAVSASHTLPTTVPCIACITSRVFTALRKTGPIQPPRHYGPRILPWRRADPRTASPRQGEADSPENKRRGYDEPHGHGLLEEHHTACGRKHGNRELDRRRADRGQSPERGKPDGVAEAGGQGARCRRERDSAGRKVRAADGHQADEER